MKSNRNGKPATTSRTFRRTLLATACMVAAGTAYAQSSIYTFTPANVPNPATTQSLNLTTFVIQSLNDQLQFGQQLANNLVTLVTETHGPGGGPNAYTVTTNSIQAIARGNLYKAPVLPTDPKPIQSLGALGTNDTLGMLSGQVNSSRLNANVTNGTASIVLTGMTAGTDVLSSNNLIATTTINQADTQATGKLPTGYGSATTGSINANSSATITSTVTGSTSMVNQQVAYLSGPGVGSAATVTNSAVTLDLAASVGALSASQTVQSNTLAANYTANSGSTRFQADSGSAPVNASVAVSNSQANVEGATSAGLTAQVTGSSVIADYTHGAGATNLTSALVVSSNTLSAASVGNQATQRDAQGNVIAGNSIILDNGVDMTGPGSARSNSLTAANNNLTAAMGADLVLLNGQGNQNTGLSSDVATGIIRARGDNVLTGGSITLDSNTVSATVTGNVGANRIQTGAANLTGSVAAGNFQANDATTMASTASNASISIQVGTALSNNGVVEGALTANTNTINASSTGSAADTNVSLGATNLTLTSTGAGVTANTTAFGSVASTAGVGATANNMQGNYGATTVISGIVSGSSVRIDVFDQQNPAQREVIGLANVSANGNMITGAGTGNSAHTVLDAGVAGSGTTNGSGTAAVGNDQFNGNQIVGTVTNSAVGISAYGIRASQVSANTNTLAATATANVADNGLSSTLTNLTTGTSAFGAGSAATSTVAGTSASNAAFAIASGQKNEAPVTSSNTSTGAFVQVDATSAGTFGIDQASNVSVNGNQGLSTTTGNQATNTLGLNATNLNTQTGAAGQVASISNLQQNVPFNVANAALATVQAGGGQMFGIVYDGGISGSNLSVSSNRSAATVYGNTAGNTINLNAQNFNATTSATASGSMASDPVAGTSNVINAFALTNRQDDDATVRTATNRGSIIGVNIGATPGAIADSTLTVSGNKVDGEARNNNATNALNLVGVNNTNLTTGGGVLNEQSSATAVDSLIDNSRIRIQAGTGTTVDNSKLAIENNAVKGIAVGNSAGNSLTAAGANLTGNATMAAAGTTIVATAASTLTTNADFGVGNVQRQTDNVASQVQSHMRINFDGSVMNVGAGGTATIDNNSITSVAQANFAENSATLASTNITATGAVSSFQSATGNANATQTTQAPGGENASLAIIGLTSNGVPLVVNKNSILSLAGQNDATNSLMVSGTNVNGRGFNNPSAYVPATSTATTGTDYSVTNVQTGGAGTVNASALPGLIGSHISNFNGGSMSVTNNDVTAKATVNNATNNLLLNSGAAAATATTLNASAAVNNAQTSTGGGVTASVGGASAITIGIGQPVGPLPVALNGTAATVSGNSLSAFAGGNNGTNALVANANGSVAAASGVQPTNPTFAVLNYQDNAATMSATVTNASIGVMTGATGSLLSSNTTVSNNNVLASGYGNTASNSLTTTTLVGNANQSLMTVSNTQRNTASVTSLVNNVTMGSIGGSSTGSAGVTSNNSSIAQSIGNQGFNSIVSK